MTVQSPKLSTSTLSKGGTKPDKRPDETSKSTFQLLQFSCCQEMGWIYSLSLLPSKRVKSVLYYCTPLRNSGKTPVDKKRLYCRRVDVKVYRGGMRTRL